MKKPIRRLLCLAMALMLILALAGCGRNAAQDSEKDTEKSGGQAAVTPVSGEAGSVSSGDAEAYNGLFDTSRVHAVDVTISEEDWADLQANPLEKTKYKVTVVIDGETVEEVSFATKGNTSLSFVASDPDSDRYSFKLNFGKYNKDQTYHGLDKLSLNNLYSDATYLKDFLSYELFRQVGVDAPLVSYVWLTINGTDHGLYLAIEEIEDAWLDRTQEGEGVLYKPESEQLDNIGQGGNPGGQGDFQGWNGQGGFPGGNGQGFPGGNGQGFPGGAGRGEMPTPPDGNQGGFPGGNGQGFPGGDGSGQFPTPPDGSGEGGFPGGNGQGFPGGSGETPTPPDGSQGDFSGWSGEGFPGGMGFGGSSKGADLRYTDDDPDSYSDIFDNTETDADDGAQTRVIAALKALSEGSAAEALDTDEVIRYFAAHNFTLNYDSYTGTMLHNYYLYEKDGKLSMLPWDYNLAFGGFGGGSDATTLLNTGIDTPLSGGDEESRPMWSWITADESSLEAYHAVCDELLTKYFESGVFEAQLNSLYAMLRPYVEKDPTAFYTVEEFDTAVETLRQVCLIRAESIRAQLEGSLSTRTLDQAAADRIDASGVNISAMGSHMGGGDRKGRK